MLRNGRRVIVAGGASAREMFANVSAERDQLTRDLAERDRELAWTRRDLAMAQQSVHELRDAINELLAARRAREMAEAELAALYREREIARARAAERDPALPLN
jgi:septal ring factor EnvC (AmiA/AmiB activator)